MPSQSKVSHADMANAIRALSMDAIQRVGSGHPGLPLGGADVATVLFTQFLKFDPKNPEWPDRDRFVLSAGHGSMLMYSLAYLLGYEITIDDIKQFRRLGSKTPGHPELDLANGIECTTGPLGQGIGFAVGMALAERMMREKFGSALCDHYTYALAGDGCLMEGISYEAAALAAHWGLDRLIVLFDDNGITIDGPTSIATSEDQEARFRACGWDWIGCDGHDPDAIAAAIAKAKVTAKPTVVACKTTIGFGAPTKAGKSAAHGAPLGDEEIEGVRKNIGWPYKPFEVPDEIVKAWRKAGARNADACKAWKKRLADSKMKSEFNAWTERKLPKGWDKALLEVKKAQCEAQKVQPTRAASKVCTEALMPMMPNFIGGSADLTPSNMSRADGTEVISKGHYTGQYIHYGVREHAMGAINVGMTLHKGVIPYCSTFFVFVDYMRTPVRLSALMEQPALYVYTHDSITQGPDGPTHQAVEHFAMMRATPNIVVLRPACGVEVAECWEVALKQKDRPTVLLMTRENSNPFRNEHTDENLCAKGGYVFSDPKDAKVTLIATGSECWVAKDAAELLAKEGIPARVVSLPSFEIFEEQSEAYRKKVLGDLPRVSIEAGSKFGWDRYVGEDGLIIGMDGFGISAMPYEIMEPFGMVPDKVCQTVKKFLKKK